MNKMKTKKPRAKSNSLSSHHDIFIMLTLTNQIQKSLSPKEMKDDDILFVPPSHDHMQIPTPNKPASQSSTFLEDPGDYHASK